MLWKPPRRDDDPFDAFDETLADLRAAQKLVAEKLLAATLLAHKISRLYPDIEKEEGTLKRVGDQTPGYWFVDVLCLTCDLYDVAKFANNEERKADLDEAFWFLRHHVKEPEERRKRDDALRSLYQWKDTEKAPD